MAKAMILAAGQGTRVRPLTKLTPKPMVPILGKPVLEYIIEHLARHGITDIMINVAFKHWKIENYFGDGHRWGVNIGYSYEGVMQHGEVTPKPLGSAGGMKKIQQFSGFFDQTTVVLCGDAIIDLDITAAIEQHRASQALASVVTLEVPLEQVPNYGVVVSNEQGRVTSFQEKPSQQAARSRDASTGIYIFEPEIIDLVPPGVEYDIGGELFPLLVERQLPFFAQRHQFSWIDIGRVTDYWAVQQQVLKGEVAQMHMPGREVRPGVWVGLNVRIDWDTVEIQGPVYIGSGTEVEPGVSIEGPTWIGHGCKLRTRSEVKRSVLFEYTRLSAGECFHEVIASPAYCVGRDGRVTYPGDDSVLLRWGDARA
jgi:mannose-1-phosphate guanylyltransferase